MTNEQNIKNKIRAYYRVILAIAFVAFWACWAGLIVTIWCPALWRVPATAAVVLAGTTIQAIALKEGLEADDEQ